jgi:deoxyxylulose-5-phosphate synthase
MPDKFIEHGEQKELYAECHFDAAAIERTGFELMLNLKAAIA